MPDGERGHPIMKATKKLKMDEAPEVYINRDKIDAYQGNTKNHILALLLFFWIRRGGRLQRVILLINIRRGAKP